MIFLWYRAVSYITYSWLSDILCVVIFVVADDHNELANIALRVYNSVYFFNA